MGERVCLRSEKEVLKEEEIRIDKNEKERGTEKWEIFKAGKTSGVIFQFWGNRRDSEFNNILFEIKTEEINILKVLLFISKVNSSEIIEEEAEFQQILIVERTYLID